MVKNASINHPSLIWQSKSKKSKHQFFLQVWNASTTRINPIQLETKQPAFETNYLWHSARVRRNTRFGPGRVWNTLRSILWQLMTRIIWKKKKKKKRKSDPDSFGQDFDPAWNFRSETFFWWSSGHHDVVVVVGLNLSCHSFSFFQMVSRHSNFSMIPKMVLKRKKVILALPSGLSNINGLK